MAGGLTLPGAMADVVALRRDPRYAKRGFAPFPFLKDTGFYGIGTYGSTETDLLIQGFTEGSRLIDTSPDYRNGDVEESVGWATEQFKQPVFTMTQIPVDAWESKHKRVEFQRALRRSLGKLRRGDVEALFIRNAEPGQLTDPDFRAFARDVKESRTVQSFGASGHGPDIEKILELTLDDDLFEFILFGAHLARFQNIPALLREAKDRGKRLIAMKTREAALWNQEEGWKKESERRQNRPWDGGWELEFSRHALEEAIEETGADQALISIRRPEDLAVLRTTR
jgi:aryl-alcohol dehydrogenase-like predicted oxidoreductase